MQARQPPPRYLHRRRQPTRQMSPRTWPRRPQSTPHRRRYHNVIAESPPPPPLLREKCFLCAYTPSSQIQAFAMSSPGYRMASRLWSCAQMCSPHMFCHDTLPPKDPTVSLPSFLMRCLPTEITWLLYFRISKACTSTPASHVSWTDGAFVRYPVVQTPVPSAMISSNATILNYAVAWSVRNHASQRIIRLHGIPMIW